MVPSALRTLSVVTLLSAVSGTVFLVSNGPGSAASAAAVSASLGKADPRSAAGLGSRSGAFSAAAPGVHSIPAPHAQNIAYQVQRSAETTERTALRERVANRARALATAKAEAQAKAVAKARAKAKALKAAKAKAVAEAAAERRRAAARQEASRSARRDPQALARIMVADRGWSSGQFSCLKSLWTRESGWNYQAMNPSSGAYGIPQSLPGRKMASAGSDWRTNPATQIKWGLDYIDDRYGTPCGAWAHSEASGWY